MFFLAADADARGRGRCGCKGTGTAATGPAIEGLDLTEAQSKRLAELRAAHAESIAATRAELDARRVELRDLWSTERPDRKAILAKQAEMDLLRQKLREVRMDHRLAVQEILTTDQRAQLSTLQGQAPGSCCQDVCTCSCGGGCCGCGKGFKGGRRR
jgi:Spy/CpxP family protein refolding chaperone